MYTTFKAPSHAIFSNISSITQHMGDIIKLRGKSTPKNINIVLGDDVLTLLMGRGGSWM